MQLPVRFVVAKFDRDDKDSLVAWSKTRAKELAIVNSRLERNNLRNTLLYSFNNNGWNLYNSYGLWVFDSFSGYHCFLPFGYGWSSPYGFGFGRDIWYFRLPQTIYNQPPMNTGNGRITNNNNDRLERRINPPFERMQKEIVRDHPQENTRDNDTIFTPQINPSPRISPPQVNPPSGQKGKPNDN